MWILLCSLVILVSGLAVAAPPPSTPAMIEKGKTSFSTSCMVCHGEKADGKGPAGASLNPPPRNFSTDKFKQGEKPQQVFNTISKGIPNTSMAPFGHLPEEERWALTYYVLSFKKKK